MANETILTDDEIHSLIVDFEIECDCGIETYPVDNIVPFSRAIEQAVLQSPEIQALRKDAEMFQYLLGEAWFQMAFDRFDPDDGGIQSKFELECRRILNTSMEKQP